MIGRVLALAIGLFGALAGSQLPEFAQQYRQRLGGAIDELRRVVTRFDEDAQASGLNRPDALRRLGENIDPLVRRQGETATEMEARLHYLQRQQSDLAEAGPFGRLLIFVRDADPRLARATYLEYEPAVPATGEGVAAGSAGFVAGWGGLLFLSRIFGRLRPRRRSPALRSA